MTEMIERVKRAIAEKQHCGWLYDEKSVAMLDPVKIDIINRDLEAAAVAAIEAMREPTKAMVTAGETFVEYSAEACWAKMIDAALKGEES